jgi:hypothetical protein
MHDANAWSVVTTETDDPIRSDVRMSTTLPLPPPPRARFTSIGLGEHVLGFGLAFPAIDASRVTLLSTSEDETNAVGSTTTTTERAAGFDAKKESTASLGRALGELLMECDVSYLYVGVKRTNASNERTRRTNERTNERTRSRLFFFF